MTDTSPYRYGLIGNICRAGAVDDFDACLVSTTDGSVGIIDGVRHNVKRLNHFSTIFNDMAGNVELVGWISFGGVINHRYIHVNDYTVIVEARAGKVRISGSSVIVVGVRHNLRNDYYRSKSYLFATQVGPKNVIKTILEKY